MPQGSFTFMVGASSSDIRLENTATFDFSLSKSSIRYHVIKMKGVLKIGVNIRMKYRLISD